ncbi:hypothetical protein KOR42_01800 [Thalassoglobus neptunius]|uniref:Uncharacterized protein n=2 Tax=Thalassoglobus neptunius TaxID=1938619 RepID=A0A5C5X3R9_9PLAN|nr:hypothetical protein KOR42_01800 [Thalassoglobus neptunius]
MGNRMAYKIKESTPDPKRPEETVQPQGKTVAAKPSSEASGRSLSRLTSLDAFRGFIMIMLAANGFGTYALSQTEEPSQLWTIIDHQTLEKIAFHFEHPPWQSNFVPGSMDAGEGNAWAKWKVSFWDLIQPAFMFMVGMAMPFSYSRRSREGQSRWRMILHALIRAVVLVLLGVFLYSRNEPSTHWLFTNVLAQIGLGYFILFLIFQLSRRWQWASLAAVLVVTTCIMQFAPPTGQYVPELVNASYEQGEILAPPYERWSKNWNAFSDFDVWFLNQFPRPERDDPEEIPFRFNRGGYTTLNFLPSIVTMLLGAIIGQFVMTAPRSAKTFWVLVGAALLCTSLGVFAGATCCPIIKRIWTPAWALFSGGYVIGMLAIFYLIFDVWSLKRLAFPLVVVGMNSIAVYMMGQMLKGWIYREIVTRHFGWLIHSGLNQVARMTDSRFTGAELFDMFHPVIQATSVALVIWLICYWMFRQRIFIRI